MRSVPSRWPMMQNGPLLSCSGLPLTMKNLPSGPKKLSTLVGVGFKFVQCRPLTLVGRKVGAPLFCCRASCVTSSRACRGHRKDVPCNGDNNHSHNYNSLSRYVVIFWTQDKASVFDCRKIKMKQNLIRSLCHRSLNSRASLLAHPTDHRGK